MIKNNFRPISNLAFSGKLMEHIVADQTISHLNKHNLMEEKQLTENSIAPKLHSSK